MILRAAYRVYENSQKFSRNPHLHNYSDELAEYDAIMIEHVSCLRYLPLSLFLSLYHIGIRC